MKRFEIYWVALDPTIGAEMQKTRPAAIISPDEMNDSLSTVIIAPITSRERNFVTRVAFELNGKTNFLALDQIKTADKTRLQNKMGFLDDKTARQVCQKLQEIFDF